MCQFRLSPCDLFFVFCFVEFFLWLSLVQTFALVVLSFYHFEGSFHFWALLWGLVLRPFSTCSSLMSFSLFLMASFSYGCFFFCFVLFSLGCRRALFSLLCATFVVVVVAVVLFCFCWAVYHPALSLLVLFSALC